MGRRIAPTPEGLTVRPDIFSAIYSSVCAYFRPEKEHMLIAIMANTAQSLPYTQYIVWTQVLPQYFNQQYARSFAYQFLIALSTNFIGYGLAGLTRRFIGE